MTVYVDSANLIYRGRPYCHMLADTQEELMEMARKLNLREEWLQRAHTSSEHFDVSPAIRKKAVELGAVEVNHRRIARIIADKNDIYRRKG